MRESTVHLEHTSINDLKRFVPFIHITTIHCSYNNLVIPTQKKVKKKKASGVVRNGGLQVELGRRTKAMPEYVEYRERKEGESPLRRVSSTFFDQASEALAYTTFPPFGQGGFGLI